MDFDDLPIGERLDALLRQFDEGNNDPEGELDYAEFVERRAHERGDYAPESDAGLEDTAAAGQDSVFESDAEHRWFESDEEPLLSPLSSPGRAQSPSERRDSRLLPAASPRTPKPKRKPKRQQKSKAVAQAEAPSNAVRPVDEHVAGVYAEAGIALPGAAPPSAAPAKRRTAKPTQRELEEAARQNQRLERMLVDDIGCHTVKTVTVDDFLSEFDSTRSSPVSSPARPQQADKRFSELVSSPPRMQGLRSFVAHGDSHRHGGSGDSAAPVAAGDADSDSDLEIIPETRAARMSQPIRELLRFGGGTAADRQLAATRAKLQQMEREQIVTRSRMRVQKLKEQGFDVDGLTNALNEQRQASAQGAAAWLARERAEAAALGAVERSDEGEEASNEEDEDEAFSSDLEIEDAGGAGPGLDEAARSSVARHGRKMVLSDSEDEPELPNQVPPGAASQPQPRQAAPALRKASRPGPATGEPEADTDEDEGESFTGGTQYVAPLSPGARAALFGPEVASLEPAASALHAGSNASDAGSDALADTLPDTQDDNAMPSIAHGAGESSDLEIEVGRDAAEESRVEPDLADLRDADLSLSQRMAEVRERYLRAEHEQRRQLIQQKQADPTRDAAHKLRPPLRSAFVEDQAEESDDEEGAGGLRRRPNADADDADDDDENDAEADADLAGLVDHAAVDVRAARLKQKFIAEERQRDERLLNHFVDGVNGGFRRRQARDANGLFLSDDDMEFDNNEELRAYRQMLEQKRQSKLLGSNSRVARLAGSERNQAFLQSITTELIARPPGAERSSTVQDGLQFLRSVADAGQRQSRGGPAAPARDAGTAGTAGDAGDDDAAPVPTGLSAALKLASLRNPKQARRPSRQATMRDPFSSGLAGRRTTYASRVSAAETPAGKTVEIMQSLGPAQPARPKKKKFVAGPAAPAPKRRPMLSTTAHETGSALFRRNWS